MDRTGIMDADRNWTARLGERPPDAFGADIMGAHVRRAVDEGLTPESVADLVAGSITGLLTDVPGLPTAEELLAEVASTLEEPPAG